MASMVFYTLRRYTSNTEIQGDHCSYVCNLTVVKIKHEKFRLVQACWAYFHNCFNKLHTYGTCNRDDLLSISTFFLQF